MTTPKQMIAQMRERANAATEGPWVCDLNGNYENRVAETDTMHICSTAKVNIDQTLDDAEFIAHARTDLPAVLELLEKAIEMAEQIVAADYRGNEPVGYRKAREFLSSAQDWAGGKK